MEIPEKGYDTDPGIAGQTCKTFRFVRSLCLCELRPNLCMIRSKMGMDKGFYTGIITWPLLQSLCRILVRRAYQKR